MARLRGIKARHPLGSVPTRSGVSPLTVVASASSATASGTGVKISELPAADAANDTDQLEVNQSGTSRRLTVAQIAVATVSGTVNVRAFGALGDDAHDDYPAIQAAINAVKASPGYGTILIPPGVYRLISGEIVLDADNLHLIVSAGATLKQMAYGWSTVQIRNANGCSVTGGGRILNTLDKTTVIGGLFDGQPARQRFCGVYCIGANDTVIDGLTFDNVYVGIAIRPTDPLTIRSENNTVRNCLFKTFDFGVLPQSQRNLVIDNLIGRTTVDSQNVPPHLIYMTYQEDAALKSESVAISNCVDYDNPSSSSFKIKHTNGISMTNLTSRKCARGFDINCENATLVAPQIPELVDIADSSQGGIVLTECSNIEIIDPYIILPDNNDLLESIAPREDAFDITVRGGCSSAMRTAANTNGHIRVYGTRVKLIDMLLVDRGVAKHPVTFHSTAVDCALIRPHVQAAAGNLVLRFEAGATNSRIIINQDQLNFDFNIATSVQDLGSIGTRTSFEGRLLRATSASLPATTTYQDAQVIVSNSAAGKNPARNDNRVWYYPDGTTVVSNGEALGWSAALVAAGGTAVSTPRLAIIQTFIDAEKASGAWYLTDDYWCLWGENATQGLYSLKQRRFLTIGGGAPVFTADRGYAFDGVADWINSNFAPATHGVAMTGTSLRLAWYERVNVGTTTYVAGIFETTIRNLRSRPRTSGNINQSDVNCAATTFASGILDSRGYTVISRADTVFVAYKNGVGSAPVVPASSGTALPNGNIYLGGLNNAGVAGSFRATSLGLVAIGASLTAAQELAQYNAVQAWATSIGANV